MYSATNTTLTSGCRPNHAITRRRQRRQPLRSRAGSKIVARENGQCARAIPSARQPRARATTSSGARQFIAWLSPTSATVAAARAAGAPNAHTPRAPSNTAPRPSFSVSVHGGLGMSSASAGRGTTDSRVAGLRHGWLSSRAAAPKQPGGLPATGRRSAAAAAVTRKAEAIATETACAPRCGVAVGAHGATTVVSSFLRRVQVASRAAAGAPLQVQAPLRGESLGVALAPAGPVVLLVHWGANEDVLAATSTG